MANVPPTVTQLKERFINTQVLHLSTSLSPSSSFRASNDQSDSPLEPRHVQSVVSAVENAIATHCRRIFVPQAIRAVAEQISDTYTKEAERKLDQDEGDDDGVGKEIDLSDESVIENLPSTWASEKDTTEYPLEAQRYNDAIQPLTTLNSQRKDIKLRVERLRRLKETIDPLKTSDGGVGIQENLATRNGPVEKELERMRMLLIRVTGRVGTLKEDKGRNNYEDEEPLSVARKRNIDDFLADPAVFPGA